MSAHNLAEALRLAREWFNHEEAGVGPQAFEVIAAADAALAAHEAEQQAGEAVADWTDVRMELEASGRMDLSSWVEQHTYPLQPLSDEQIEDLYFDGFSISKLKEFARAIEAAHGIGITKDTK